MHFVAKVSSSLFPNGEVEGPAVLDLLADDPRGTVNYHVLTRDSADNGRNT